MDVYNISSQRKSKKKKIRLSLLFKTTDNFLYTSSSLTHVNIKENSYYLFSYTFSVKSVFF